MACRYFLTFVILTTCFVAGQSPKYVLNGQEVKLNPGITGHPDHILWTLNGNKVVEFNGQEEYVYGRYESRITLNWHTAELHITDLRFEDSGEYELEVYMNKNWQQLPYKVDVIDEVSEPTISCEMNDGSGSNISATLACTAEPRQPQSLMKFEWSSDGNMQPGPQLTIHLGDKHDDEVHSCTVSNPLSTETATFTAKDCYPHEGSSVALTAGLVTFFVFIILLLAAGIWFCHRSQKACFAKGKRGDLEKHSPSGAKEGAGEDAAEDDERGHLFDSAPTQKENLASPGHVQQKILQYEANNDEKNMTPRGHTGSVKKTAQDDQRRSLLDRTPTLPSTQPLGHLGYRDTVKGLEKTKNKQEDAATPPPPRSESPSHVDENNPANSDKGDADADQLGERAEKEIPLCSNEPDPAGVLADCSEDTESELESSTASEQPEHDLDSQDETPQKGSVKKTAQDDQRRSLLDRTPTLPSTQPLGRLGHRDTVKGLEKTKNKQEDAATPPPRSESPSHVDETNPANSDKGDADADQLGEPAEKEIPLCSNEPDPAGVLADCSEDTESELESSTASEQPELKQEPDEEEAKPPENVSTTAQPPSPLTQSSPNMAPKDTAGEHKDNTNLDQVNGETDRNSSDVKKTDESDDSIEDKQPSTIPKEEGSETTLREQGETDTSEDDHL